jgi:carbonic anhydrase/acetyltransferase-like protein (isoleucine patch superfamily)
MAKIDKNALRAPGVVVVGEVTIEEDVNIWYHSTLRGDRASIQIGRGSNLQDNCVVHGGMGANVTVGEYVTIGHGAIIHGCQIGGNTLVGMGAILMNHAVIGNNCIIGAGALVPQNAQIPDNCLVIGNPGQIVRNVTKEEIVSIHKNAEIYINLARQNSEFHQNEPQYPSIEDHASQA